MPQPWERVEIVVIFSGIKVIISESQAKLKAYFMGS